MMHQDDAHQVPEWAGTERRGIDGITLKLMAEVRAAMDKHEKDEQEVFTELKTMIKEKDEASEKRHRDLGARFDAMQQSTSSLLFENNKTTQEIHKLFKAAFPEGDAESHRKAHERWIEKDKADREFWIKLKGDAIRWAFIAVAGWAGLALWSAFLKGPAA
jgi:hypothetical protein